MPAKVMLEVARFKPGKRRRLKFVARQRPELLQQVLGSLIFQITTMIRKA